MRRVNNLAGTGAGYTTLRDPDNNDIEINQAVQCILEIQ